MTPTVTDHLIRASKLTKRFGAYTAVDRIDINLARTGITALIGPNGAGKTTLFNLITGQIAPDEGEVFLDGVDVTKSAAHVMARHGVGRSFQDVRLFGAMSVRENVATYAQRRQTSNLALTLLTPLRQRRLNQEALQKAEEVLRYLKISSMGAIRADTLGFAQQKLVAIARLLALSPRILFLDEPASGLDHAGRQTLSSTISRLAGDGYSVCFVEHNTHLVRELATRVLFLNQGRILADGDPDTVFSDPRLAETYLGLV